MFHYYFVDVATFVSVFQLLLFRGATYDSQCFNVFLANVADVEFRCCRHVMLGVASNGREEGPQAGCCKH
jgi:hypothetical protein